MSQNWHLMLNFVFCLTVVPEELTKEESGFFSFLLKDILIFACGCFFMLLLPEINKYNDVLETVLLLKVVSE